WWWRWLEEAVASTMVLMVIGHGIVKLETGRISVTNVEMKATSKETARIVQKASSMCEVFLICSLSLYVYNDVEQTPVVVVPNIQIVGNAFTELYYHILQQYLELVYRGFECFKDDQGQMVLCQQCKPWMTLITRSCR
ncbi:hypothetical protein MKW92_042641, partial [Papaver armeniacum]